MLFVLEISLKLEVIFLVLTMSILKI